MLSRLQTLNSLDIDRLKAIILANEFSVPEDEALQFVFKEVDGHISKRQKLQQTPRICGNIDPIDNISTHSDLKTVDINDANINTTLIPTSETIKSTSTIAPQIIKTTSQTPQPSQPSQPSQGIQEPKNKKPNKASGLDWSKTYRRKIALHISYVGTNYSGLAIQDGDVSTVEGHLFHALQKTCLVPNMEQSNYSRCGRTDKGVSALSQVVSLDVRSLYPFHKEKLKELQQYITSKYPTKKGKPKGGGGMSEEQQLLHDELKHEIMVSFPKTQGIIEPSSLSEKSNILSQVNTTQPQPSSSLIPAHKDEQMDQESVNSQDILATFRQDRMKHLLTSTLPSLKSDAVISPDLSTNVISSREDEISVIADTPSSHKPSKITNIRNLSTFSTKSENSENSPYKCGDTNGNGNNDDDDNCDNDCDRYELDYVGLLNNILPSDIRVFAWSPVDDNFNARFSCDSRTYKYFFYRDGMDLDAMRIAASYLKGTHDFRNFCKMDVVAVTHFIRRVCDATIRPTIGGISDISGVSTHSPISSTTTVNIAATTDESSMNITLNSLPSDTLCEFVVTGEAFLYHQVRCMIAILFLVGKGVEKPEIVRDLFDLQLYPRKPVYDIASEQPLVLWDGAYRGMNWKTSRSGITKSHVSLYQKWRDLRMQTVIYEAMWRHLSPTVSQVEIPTSISVARYNKKFETTKVVSEVSEASEMSDMSKVSKVSEEGLKYPTLDHLRNVLLDELHQNNATTHHDESSRLDMLTTIDDLLFRELQQNPRTLHTNTEISKHLIPIAPTSYPSLIPYKVHTSEWVDNTKYIYPNDQVKCANITTDEKLPSKSQNPLSLVTQTFPHIYESQYAFLRTIGAIGFQLMAPKSIQAIPPSDISALFYRYISLETTKIEVLRTLFPNCTTIKEYISLNGATPASTSMTSMSSLPVMDDQQYTLDAKKSRLENAITTVFHNLFGDTDHGYYPYFDIFGHKLMHQRSTESTYDEKVKALKGKKKVRKDESVEFLKNIQTQLQQSIQPTESELDGSSNHGKK